MKNIGLDSRGNPVGRSRGAGSEAGRRGKGKKRARNKSIDYMSKLLAAFPDLAGVQNTHNMVEYVDPGFMDPNHSSMGPVERLIDGDLKIEPQDFELGDI